MKMLSTIALFTTLMCCAAAAPMGRPPSPGAKADVSNTDMPGRGDGPGAGRRGPSGMMGGSGRPNMGGAMGMHPPLNISSECMAAINSTCSACPAANTSGGPMQPPSGDGPRHGGRGHGPAPGNNTQMNTCFKCIQTHSDDLIAAGCDHLKCPAAMAATCPDCPRPGANDSCRALCEGKRNSTECRECRDKCRKCIDENTDDLIAAGCKELACAKLINTTCPDCAPNDKCRSACDLDRNSSECTQCHTKRTACGSCLTENNSTLADAGCQQPHGPKEGDFDMDGHMHMGKGGMGGDMGKGGMGGNDVADKMGAPMQGPGSNMGGDMQGQNGSE